MSLDLVLFTLFTIKHFVCDFPLQQPYHYLNKGKYFHPGGIHHALIHLVGTFIVVSCFMYFVKTTDWDMFTTALVLGFADFILHYHIDWAKVNINNHFGWTATSAWFWYLVGFDQMLHYLTYIGFVAYVVNI